MSFKDLRVNIAAVLYTTVRVMNESLCVFSLVKRFVKSSNTTTKFKAITEVVTNDLTRVSISDQRQITKAFNGSDIGNIAYPDLVRSGSFKILDDVMILIESVQGISGSGAVFLSKGEHVVFSKNIEQGISTNFKIGFSKLRIQRSLKFTHTFSRKRSASFVY